MILFRQFFDPTTCTLTHLLADPLSGDAVIIDSVREHVGAYLTCLQEQELQLDWILETHLHGDHVTGAASLAETTGARIALGRHAGTGDQADRLLDDGDAIVFGGEVIRAIATPGHTPGCMSYLWRDRLFTGDSLMIHGCGRTDFGSGDAGTLYDSITGKLFTLPDETLVYPGHDYRGLRVSCIGQEKAGNPRLAGRSREEFAELAASLVLPRPPAAGDTLAANLRCGHLPAERHGL